MSREEAVTDPIRVVVWSTGGVGSVAVDGIRHRPDLKLVGVWVHSPDKVGKDAGELVGGDPIGLAATNDADALIAEAGGPAWDAAGFARLTDHVRPRLHAATHDVVTWAEEILRAAHDARIRLDGLRSPVLQPATDDIRRQLDELIYPGFLTAAGAARLPSLARYLKAVGRRLDKLPDNAGRDAQQMAVVHRVQDAYRQAQAGLLPEARSGEAATEIRWLTEELRVSLFAQTIGTPLPVSERRIMTAIEHLS